MCSDWCAICFRPQRSEGKNFEIIRRDKKSSVSKFRFLVDNRFEGGQTELDDWDHRGERSNEGRKIQ